jgi:hypothetical protein
MSKIKKLQIGESYNFIQEKELHKQNMITLRKFYMDDLPHTTENLNFKKSLNKKMNGYKNQDTKNEIFSSFHFISSNSVLEMLLTNNFKCFYCKIFLHLYPSIKRDPYQWTLDRVDNSLGHNEGNIVIACLKCNLQRRNQDKNKFKQGKNIVLNKINKII